MTRGCEPQGIVGGRSTHGDLFYGANALRHPRVNNLWLSNLEGNRNLDPDVYFLVTVLRGCELVDLRNL